MYLYGSLATGDYQPGRSDIDFLALTRELPSPEVVRALGAFHHHLARTSDATARKLEGAYVPRLLIRRHDRNHPPVPTLHETRFYMAPLGIDWVIQRYVLRKYGVVIAGPEPKTFIDPVEGGHLRSAVCALLEEWWQPMIQEPSWLERPGYQSYAVLSMCRCAFTLEHGEIINKSDATRWAQARWPIEWGSLILQADAWREGMKPGDLEKTIDFINFVCRLRPD
jgi:hypothetical protein